MKFKIGLLTGTVLCAGIASAQSLGDLARAERIERRHETRQVRVYTNEDLPHDGMISFAGKISESSSSTDTAADKSKSEKNGAEAKDKAASSKDEEATWRERFAKARHQLALDQREVDVEQRELNLARVQYYSDPAEALKQQLTGADIQNHMTNIEALKTKVQADQAAISNLEDELRRQGLPPGWAR